MTLILCTYLNPTTEERTAFRLEPSESAQLSAMQFHTYNVPTTPATDQISEKKYSLCFFNRNF